ncbi:MAG: decarboxylating NADP(+)-dependent phosphogluconate dehydrogenase [Saprospiraceae bacterium]|nr:decarboxylating NADP(+)-dependent phosphogluconate dehydrogenase [Saprospiraceae bacterium]
MASATIFIIMGVSGSGKTTVGILLAQQLGLPFFDGDDFHSPANKEKMRAGIPLTDDDRLTWLNSLHTLMVDQSEAKGAVIACSALKERYRAILAQNLTGVVQWIVLKGGYDLIHERMMLRKDHYMPAGLLQSQFESMEYPAYGLSFDIHDSPQTIAEIILENQSKSEFGLVGLGVMGKSLARNLGSKGVRLALYNQNIPGKEEGIAFKAITEYGELENARGFEDVGSFVASLAVPRKIFMMVPAGKPVDQVIQQILPHLQAGDVLMDGGNSHFEDTNRRALQLEEHQIHYLGIGVSGGEQGALSGPSIMPGGEMLGYELVKKYLDSIAAKDRNGQACCAYMGPGGAGHFVKMIHNGIEYAEMQLLAEIYWIMREGLLYSPDQIASIVESWNELEARGYLLEITIKILRHHEDGKLVLDQIADIGGSKGTGSWSLTAAAQLGMPANLIGEALFARFVSSFKQDRLEAAKSMEVFTNGFSLTELQLKQAYVLSRWVNHHQGVEILDAASREYRWELDLPAIAGIWTNGCIIRSALMEELSVSLTSHPNILFSRLDKVKDSLSDLTEVVTASLKARLAIPCLSAALNFVLNYSSADSPINLIQAQRDFFGAHTYRRKEDPFGKSYHTHWEQDL